MICGDFGRHQFIFTASTNGSQEPKPWERCSCGLYTWQEIKEICRKSQLPGKNLEQLRAENARLREALLEMEWIKSEYAEWVSFCPCCKNTDSYGNEEHKPNCIYTWLNEEPQHEP